MEHLDFLIKTNQVTLDTVRLRLSLDLGITLLEADKIIYEYGKEL
jgi:hypothetical protein